MPKPAWPQQALPNQLSPFNISFYLTSSLLRTLIMNKLRQTILCFASILYFSIAVIAQDRPDVHKLLLQIEDQQLRHDPFFMPGIFPSYVSNKKIYKELRKDNNVFYTAVIAYTLRTLKSQLNSADQPIADSIIARSERSIAPFKNREGRETYNFWRTDSAYRLPYLWGLGINKKNMLDDDPDCTSMCLLSLNAPLPHAQVAHTIMQDYVNDCRNPTHTTFSRYRSYGAYSTWLGDRLPVVFDICVLSNVLTLVQTYDLRWTKADSASLDLILATLNHKDHVANPAIVAPYYGSTSVILYHLARLMSIKPIAELEKKKDELVNEALQQLETTNNEFEKMILGTALMKWNGKALAAGIRINDIEKSNLPFFIGNIPSIFNFTFKKPLSTREIGFYYHYCPAYNNVLLLEYLMLKNKNERGFAVNSGF